MADFLLELRCEEIPARMQAGARAELEKLFRREMEAAGVKPGELTVWSTPRRLALIARGLPTETEAVREEAKGPPVGAPDKAVEGFCRKNGVSRDQLEVREVKGRETYFVEKNVAGRPMVRVVQEAIPEVIRSFSWPKSMRWGEASISSGSTRWVRPLSSVVALLDGDVVAVVTDGLASGRLTRGHRFHSEGEIEIGSADDYAATLRNAFVIVDHEERASIIREGAAKAAAEARLTLVEDEGLVVENAGLTEWPVPLLGRFDESYLDVPPEVIQLTARVNQKYFVCEDSAGKLANAFICTANLASNDPAVVVDGNRKVLAARLSDARFFWELDQKKTLEEHAKGLERITFHEKLGTVADKVDRVAKLARWLVEEGIVKDADPDMAEQAARLAKADLVTEMVGEFPELQGLMGGYYARAEGLPDAVADAIRDHYKPVGQGDEVPTSPVTVAVSLADKLDTLFQFFLIKERPTGSKDPFALRRAAIAVGQLLTKNNLRFRFRDLFEFLADVEEHQLPSESQWRQKYDCSFEELIEDGFAPSMDAIHKEKELFTGMLLGVQHARGRDDVVEFLVDRLKVQQREAGVRHDLIDAVVALGGEDDLVRLLARVHALKAFMETEDGTNLLAGYKRAANILKKEDWTASDTRIDGLGEEDPLALAGKPEFDETMRAAQAQGRGDLSYTPEKAEKALIDALDDAAPKAEQAVEEERFEDAMAALATLRAPIDAFFEDVTVNDDDPAKRKARLDLLSRFTRAVGKVADFSRIEG